MIIFLCPFLLLLLTFGSYGAGKNQTFFSINTLLLRSFTFSDLKYFNFNKNTYTMFNRIVTV